MGLMRSPMSSHRFLICVVSIALPITVYLSGCGNIEDDGGRFNDDEEEAIRGGEGEGEGEGEAVRREQEGGKGQGETDEFFTTSIDGVMRLQNVNAVQQPASLRIDVRTDQQQQTMVGFGAALTESACYYMMAGGQEKTHRRVKMNTRLFELLFDPHGGPDGKGLRAGFARTTIGSSDYSLPHHPWSYRDDYASAFDASVEHNVVIPCLKEALKYNPQLKILASPWQPPTWMVHWGVLHGNQIDEDAILSYVTYIIQTLDFYKANGIPIYAITLQNEQWHGHASYPSLYMDASTTARLSYWLVHAMRANDHVAKVLAHDHNYDLCSEADSIMAGCHQWLDGLGWHAYGGSPGDQCVVDLAKNKYPTHDMYFTEQGACVLPSRGGFIGDWNFAGDFTWQLDKTLYGPIKHLRSKGSLQWVMALDEVGGEPMKTINRNDAVCRGLVTTTHSGDIVKTPEFYAVAHMNIAAPAGSVYLRSTTQNGVEVATFLRSEGTVSFLIYNKGETDQVIAINNGSLEKRVVAPKRSLTSGVLSSLQVVAHLNRESPLKIPSGSGQLDLGRRYTLRNSASGSFLGVDNSFGKNHAAQTSVALEWNFEAIANSVLVRLWVMFRGSKMYLAPDKPSVMNQKMDVLLSASAGKAHMFLLIPVCDHPQGPSECHKELLPNSKGRYLLQSDYGLLQGPADNQGKWPVTVLTLPGTWEAWILE